MLSLSNKSRRNSEQREHFLSDPARPRLESAGQELGGFARSTSYSGRTSWREGPRRRRQELVSASPCSDEDDDPAPLACRSPCRRCTRKRSIVILVVDDDDDGDDNDEDEDEKIMRSSRREKEERSE